MDVDDDADLPLQIPLSALMDEFGCPVCYEMISDCYMTPCGHNFCKTCLFECVNRKHQCPCCNTACTQPTCVKNHHMDQLIKILEKEKASAQQRYFASVSAGHALSKSQEAAAVQKRLSPIEEVFQKHMKKSIGSFNDELARLSTAAAAATAQLTATYTKRISECSDSSASARLKAELEAKKNDIAQDTDAKTKLLIDAYDKYMTEFAPAPILLPRTVSVLLQHSNTELDNIELKPTDSLAELRAIIAARMEERGTPMLSSFGATNVVSLLRQLSPDSPVEEVLLAEGRPLAAQRVEHGARLQVRGEVTFKPSPAAQCFATTYEKGTSPVVDYYACKQCAINWICKACSTQCHKGHEVTVYQSGHKATYGCCYCKRAKTQKCSLIKK